MFSVTTNTSPRSNAELFLFLFFPFILHFPHDFIHLNSAANACNPAGQTGTADSPLAGFLTLMSGRPSVCEGILLGSLLTLCFINLINDIYWGLLHSNQHLCRKKGCLQLRMGLSGLLLLTFDCPLWALFAS